MSVSLIIAKVVTLQHVKDEKRNRLGKWSLLLLYVECCSRVLSYNNMQDKTLQTFCKEAAQEHFEGYRFHASTKVGRKFSKYYKLYRGGSPHSMSGGVNLCKRVIFKITQHVQCDDKGARVCVSVSPANFGDLNKSLAFF